MDLARPTPGRSGCYEDAMDFATRNRQPQLIRLWADGRVLLFTVIATSSALAALAAESPTGQPMADLLWRAALGALVPLVATWASRTALIWAAGVSAILAVGGAATTATASIAVLLLIAIVASVKRSNVIVSAAIGALVIQLLLRGPSNGPVWLPIVAALAALAPLGWSSWAASSPRRRLMMLWTTTAFGIVVLIAAVGSAVVVLETRDMIQRSTDDATTGLSLLASGESENAALAFEQSATGFDSASSTLASLAAWPGRFVPVVGQNLQAVRTAATSGSRLATSAADTARRADYRLLDVQSGQIDLDRIATFEQPVASSLATINRELVAIDATSSPWLVAPVTQQFGRLRDRLVEASEQTDLALAGIRAAPVLFGGDGPKRWFLSFGSPGESRNAGGFVGAYATLVADGGRLSLEKTGPIGELYRLRPPLYDFTPPPDWEERYSTYNVPVNLGNVSASPSWPVDASVMAQLYPQTPGGAPIDGAIYVDPAALAGLLSLTGAITVPGLNQRLDATNVETYLLRDQYIEFASSNNQRKDILGDVASATFNALTTRSLPSLSKIANVLGPIVAARHLQIASFAPTAESFLDRIGISGLWTTTAGSDYLSVRSANLLNNKIDAFLWRTIDVDIQLDDGNNTVHSTVTVTLRNDAPANGLPPYLIGNDRGLAAGTNRNLVTLYSPLRFESVTIDGKPAGVQIQTEFNGPVLSLPVDIDPGATVTVVFELSGAISNGPYNMEVLPQATANPDSLAVRIREKSSLHDKWSFAGPLNRTISLSTTE